MKFTLNKIAAALGLVVVAASAHAAPVALTGTSVGGLGPLGFEMYSSTGVLQDANSGQPGKYADITGSIDLQAGTFTVASTMPYGGAGKFWTASGGTLYQPGTYTVNVNGDGGNGAGAGDMTFTVGAGQIGGNIDFAWGTNVGIDVFNVWDVASTSTLTGSTTALTGTTTTTAVGPTVLTGSNTVTTFDAFNQYDTTTYFYSTTNYDTITSFFDTTNTFSVATTYMSSNPNAVAGSVLFNGVAVATDTWAGIKMVDGPFVGFSANFNFATNSTTSTVDTSSTSEVLTWYTTYSEQTVVTTPLAVPEASTYGMMLAGLGLVGFAVRRRKLVA